jgi:hypothetical protein
LDNEEDPIQNDHNSSEEAEDYGSDKSPDKERSDMSPSTFEDDDTLRYLQDFHLQLEREYDELTGDEMLDTETPELSPE